MPDGVEIDHSYILPGPHDNEREIGHSDPTTIVSIYHQYVSPALRYLPPVVGVPSPIRYPTIINSDTHFWEMFWNGARRKKCVAILIHFNTYVYFKIHSATDTVNLGKMKNGKNLWGFLFWNITSVSSIGIYFKNNELFPLLVNKYIYIYTRARTKKRYLNNAKGNGKIYSEMRECTTDGYFMYREWYKHEVICTIVRFLHLKIWIKVFYVIHMF